MNSYWVFQNNNYWYYSQESFMLDLIHGHYYGRTQRGLGNIVSKLAVL